MRDYVFIGWSRNRELAIAIKKILDEHGFICVVGGIYEGNPDSVRGRKSTVNETINFQMNHCDQSILLFQKIDDNLGISGNLIYELGYINAQYNYIESPTKLHIFRIDITQSDDNLFPTDLHGIWGTNVISAGKQIDDMAREIADEFLNNQVQNKKSNKFKLLNNYYFVEYEMKRHFKNPSMSDYDLAICMLVYVQAAFCYQEQNDIKLRMEQFKNKLVEESASSVELKWVTDYALQTLTLYCLTIPDEENDGMQLEGRVFRALLNGYSDIAAGICSAFSETFQADRLQCMLFDDNFMKKNDFEAWLVAQMQEHVTYLILVYLSNDELCEEERIKYANMGVEISRACIANLNRLSADENDKMYAELLLSYAYKNISTFYGYLSPKDGGEDMTREIELSRKKSLRLRRELYSYTQKISSVRPSLKDYITLEYLLQVVERIKLSADKYERADYMHEIKEYLEMRNRLERNRNYMLNVLSEEYAKLLEKGEQVS